MKRRKETRTERKKEEREREWEQHRLSMTE
jgi:hypothetical protein